jgi:hypothetical protein
MLLRQFLGSLALIDLLTAVISKKNNGLRKWRWYEELKEQRVRDIETEML